MNFADTTDAKLYLQAQKYILLRDMFDYRGRHMRKMAVRD